MNIQEAIGGYLASLKAHGDPIPPTISEETVEIAVGGSARPAGTSSPDQ